MNEGAFTITVDAGPAVAMLGEAAETLRPLLIEQLTAVSVLAKEEMRKRVSVGVGGEAGLKGSIDYTLVPRALASEIKPKAPYGDALETGSRPHWVSAKPGSPLAQWAALKGINVYALQHSIAKKGTKPHPYIKPTYESIAPVVNEKFALAIAAFVGRYHNGSV